MTEGKTGKSWKEQHIVLRLTAAYIFIGLIAMIVAMFTRTPVPAVYPAVFLGCLAIWEVLNTRRYGIKKRNGKK